MKFHTLLAILGVSCALSSTSYAVKTPNELDIEMRHLVCPPGKKAAKVGQFCPKGARDPLDCWRTRVKCVEQSYEDDEVQRVTVSENKEFTPAPKTQENSKPLIDIVDKIMRADGSEPKWSEGNHGIKMFFPSRT